MLFPILCIPAACPAQIDTHRSSAESTESHESLPLDPAVQTGELENGLTYYIRKNHMPEKRALLWLVVNAGSVLEKDNQRGLAHFVEHMAFNGSVRFRKNSMIDFAERAGIDFGADLNAYTSYDETVYMLTVPSDDGNVVAGGLDILEDWAGGLTFELTEVDRERGVVIEEWRQGRGARQRISDKQELILLQDSRYADRNPIGKKAILEKATASDLRQFYDDWYRPELMAVIVIGDIDTVYMEEQIRRRFSSLKPRGSTPPRVEVTIPRIEKTRVSVLTDSEASGSIISMNIKGPLTPVRNKTGYRQFLVQGLFSSMLNSRLDELHNDPDSPFIAAFNNISELGRSIDMFSLSAIPKSGKYEQSLDSVLIELDRIRRYGFLDNELVREKKSLLRAYEQSFAEEDKADSRSFARECKDHYLKQETMPGIAVEVELVKKLLPGITLAEVNELAANWSERKDRVIMASGPARDSLPDRNKLLAVTERIPLREIQPYRENRLGSSLMPGRPVPGRVVNQRQLEAIGATLWTLSNGAKVVIKPTDFKNDEILLSAISPGGLSLASNEDYRSAASATDIVFNAGLGDYDETALRKMLAGKVVWVRPYVSELEEGFYGNTTTGDLESLMQMIYLSFTAQRKDPASFATWKMRMETLVRNRDLNPKMVFNQELRAFSDNYHPRSLPLTIDRLETVNLDAAYSFLQDRYADAGDFVFVFVGNIDPARLRQLSETYLASLPASGRRETWRDVGMTMPEGTLEFTINKGEEPKSEVRITYHGDADWSPEAEQDLRLLGDVMDMRLREVLREEMGGVYGATSRGVFYRYPRERYIFSISFECAPGSVEKLRRAVFDIINSLRQAGVTQGVVSKVKQQWRRRLEINLRQNTFWVGRLIRHFRYGTDANTIIDSAYNAIERVNSKNVRKAARRYLGKDRIDGLLMPERKREE